MNKRILFVDDEENVLEAHSRNYGRMYDVTTVSNPLEAIELLKYSKPFAAVISDLKMPNMDGIEMLSQIKEINSDTARILLTGYADLENAVDAINQGSVFRFLTKPCKKEAMKSAIDAGIENYRLINSERELLNKTLNGSIKVLIDILSTANPSAFSQAIRLRKYSKIIAKALKIKNTWEIEIATLLSQIGLISVPEDILNKKFKSQKLTKEEQEMFLSHPTTGKELLKNIPRLENIANSISMQALSIKEGNDNLTLIAKLLKVVIDFDFLLQSGMPPIKAHFILDRKKDTYDPTILSALQLSLPEVSTESNRISIGIDELRSGMILIEDITDNNGVLIVPKGVEINTAINYKLRNFAKFNRIKLPIQVVETSK